MNNSALAKQLTPRDIDILLWIGRAGIGSLDQVAKRFWAGRSRQTAAGRMRWLVKAGYLEMHSCNVRTQGELVFCITEQGYRKFGSSQRERLQVGLPTPAEIKQQLMAQDTFLVLETQIRRAGGRLVEWQSERELRAELRRDRAKAQQPQHPRRALSPLDIPDARVIITTSQGDVEILYVEIDGAYYGKMLCEKAKCLAKRGQQIVWICTQERAGYVEKAVAGYPNIQVLII